MSELLVLLCIIQHYLEPAYPADAEYVGARVQAMDRCSIYIHTPDIDRVGAPSVRC